MTSFRCDTARSGGLVRSGLVRDGLKKIDVRDFLLDTSTIV